MTEESNDNVIYAQCYNRACLEHRKELIAMNGKVQQVQESVEAMVEHIHHLTQLDVIAEAVVEVKDQLLSAATGKNHVPIEIAKEYFAQSAKSQAVLHRIYGLIILSLTGIIGFLLTGEKLGWIRIVGN